MTPRLLWARRALVVLSSLVLAIGLPGCGGGTAVEPLPATQMSGHYEDDQVSLLIDPTGYAVGLSSIPGTVTTTIGFAGAVRLAADGSWSIEDAMFSASGAAGATTATTTITGTRSTDGSLSIRIPVPPRPPEFPSALSVPRQAGTVASIEELAGLYSGELSTQLRIDAATGAIEGTAFRSCGISGTITQAGEVFGGPVTMQCPQSPGDAPIQSTRLAGWASRDASGKAAQLHLYAFANGKVETTSETRAVPGYSDPALAALVPFAGEYETSTQGLSPDLYGALYVDASGRFLLWPRQQGSAGTVNDAILGTLAQAGGDWSATGARLAHRDSATSPWVSSPANVTLTFTAVPDNAARTVQLTVSATSASTITPSYTMTRTILALPPYYVPSGRFNANGNAITVIGSTGRIHGNVAAGCAIEGTMSVTSMDVDVYRLHATLQGTGCAAAGLPEGDGEFLGTEWEGPRLRDHSWSFRGVVNGQAAWFYFSVLS